MSSPSITERPAIDLSTLPVFYEVVTRLRDASGEIIRCRHERLPDTPYAMQKRVAEVDAMYAGRHLGAYTATVTIETQIDWDAVPMADRWMIA